MLGGAHDEQSGTRRDDGRSVSMTLTTLSHRVVPRSQPLAQIVLQGGVLDGNLRE
jgi:hypothetical protein